MGAPPTPAPQTQAARTPAHRPRLIIDAILYMVKGGLQWRLLPGDFPPWQTVYHVFRKWTRDHTWAWLNAQLRTRVRKQQGRKPPPTAAILDSQSVKRDAHGGAVGSDAAKQIKGRKRHLLVDTLGLVPGVPVTPASTTERDGARLLLQGVLGWLASLRLLWVDGGYCGDLFCPTGQRPPAQARGGGGQALR